MPQMESHSPKMAPGGARRAAAGSAFPPMQRRRNPAFCDLTEEDEEKQRRRNSAFYDLTEEDQKKQRCRNSAFYDLTEEDNKEAPGRQILRNGSFHDQIVATGSVYRLLKFVRTTTASVRMVFKRGCL